MSQTLSRNTLLAALNLLKPALASQPYVPAFTHFAFTPGKITATNGQVAIQVQYDHDLSCCLPGDMLVRALGTLPAGSDVIIKPHGKDANAMRLVSGRTDLKLPFLPLLYFPFDWDRDLHAKPWTCEFTQEMLDGLDRCLVAVGNNIALPAQMGVTLDAVGGLAVLFSTDDNTMSRFTTKDPLVLAAGAPVLLPTTLCHLGVTLAKAYPDSAVDLLVYDAAAVISVGVAQVMHKVGFNPVPLDYPGAFERLLKSAGTRVTIPAGWDAALQRALLVPGTNTDKVTRFSQDSHGLHMTSTSQTGESVDVLDCKPCLEGTADVDPVLLLRGSKTATTMAFGDKCVALMDHDGTFTHLVSFCETPVASKTKR